MRPYPSRPPSQAGASLSTLSMMPPAEARCELPRIHIPRTWVNKGIKKEGRSSYAPALLVIRCVSLLARQLLLGLIHQPLLFLLLPFCCSGFLLVPRLGDSADLLHPAQSIVVSPGLRYLAPREAVYCHSRELYPVAAGRNAQELPLVGT